MPEWFWSHTSQRIGEFFTPLINDIASAMTGFPQTDRVMASGKKIYPGSEHCDVYSPHALWHEESANGFLEIVLLTDYVVGLLDSIKYP